MFESSFWRWARRMGWRYLVASASLVMVGFVAYNLTGEADPLRIPLIVGSASGVVLVLAVPAERPRREIEWFKTLGSVATSAVFFCLALLSMNDVINEWAKTQGVTPKVVWSIILAVVVFSGICGALVTFLMWLLSDIIQWWKHRREACKKVSDSNAPVTAKWTEARRLADEALAAAREAGRLEGSPHP